MPGHDHGPSVKRPKQYEALRDEGMSKGSAAAISNKAAQGPAARSKMAKKAARTRSKK
jgi:hypothetical protein